MPYVAFGEGQAEKSDDGIELPPQRLSDFEFLPAQFFRQANSVVHFDYAGQLLRSAHGHGNHKGWARDRKIGASEQLNRFALLLPCMRDIGLHKVYFRVDGSHDDIFSWVSHGISENGDRVGVDALCDLIANSLRFTVDLNKRFRWERDQRSDMTVLRDTLDIDVCSLMWAPWLFGHSFGWGPYWFYGAYTVDLMLGTIVEDPHADPVVQHIAISNN